MGGFGFPSVCLVLCVFSLEPPPGQECTFGGFLKSYWYFFVQIILKDDLFQKVLRQMVPECRGRRGKGRKFPNSVKRLLDGETPIFPVIPTTDNLSPVFFQALLFAQWNIVQLETRGFPEKCKERTTKIHRPCSHVWVCDPVHFHG